MKIEFHCEQCDQHLRAADDFVDRVIVCPACHSETFVPNPDSDERATWYEPVIVDSEQAPVWAPQSVSMSEIFQDAWSLYVEHLWMLLAVAVIDLVLWVVGLALIFVPAVGTFAVLWKAVGIPPPLSVLGMFIVLALGGMTLINAMICSHAKFYLKIARGERATILDAFHIGWRRGAVTMLPTIFTAMCVTGLTLCVVPGVLVYLFFWPYVWIWADRQTGENVSQAFPMSRDLTSRNFGISLTGTTVSPPTTKEGGF